MHAFALYNKIIQNNEITKFIQIKLNKKKIKQQFIHIIKGQPSGEAFIQMDSEEAAFASAKEKHNKYMVMPGKNQKIRYIEVFQVRN